MDIIHMNGRIYDAKLARFLQADPFIQATTHTYNYNRYSYVLNNPLNMTDPSGFFFKKLHKAMMKLNGTWATHKFLNRHMPGAIPVIQGVLNFIPVIGTLISAAFSANNSFYLTGSLNNSARAFAINYVSSAAAGSIAGSNIALAEKVFAQAILEGDGGAPRWAICPRICQCRSGGRCKNGYSWKGFAVNAVVGGTVSKISGGKFANWGDKFGV